MRLSTLFASTAFVLAGLSTALPVDRENMLAARYAADFLADVKARAYDEELELYARGCVSSKTCGGGDTESRTSLLRSTSSESSSSPSSSGPSISNSPFSSFTRLLASMEPDHSGSTLSNPGSRTGYGHSGTTPTSHFPSRRRRSLYEPFETNRRRDQLWTSYR
ncbi:hypothetical protein M378DRAFT_8561 [Amanita muscaria Koide BX008]|uniref:Uncharacterized protein n=1 Tax=Amanita muscaria (strain Koide BX008) TaxID=946122 RepID=A0A0C2TMV6_AMAMK|nr:hypothetical protein M378DRAFT_8561 [Amanita muscaria Koide BX008]